MNIKNKIISSLITGGAFTLGAIIMIYGVYAFESLTTTPGDSGNQSLGSPILSKLTSGGFDRTTDSLEALSDKISAIETKVDTIDTVVDNLPTSSGVSWAGYTSNYNGDMDGSYGMNEKCNTAYPGSKAMTYQDWIDLGTDYPNTKNAWIIDGMDTIGELDDLTTNNYAITKDGNDYELFSGRDCMSINCNGWNSYSSTFKGAYVSYNNKSLYITGCNITNVPIPCVYK